MKVSNSNWDEAVDVCNAHYDRLMFAYNTLSGFFPLTQEKYLDWTEEQIAICDQMIYRFSKLQDTMGSKIFSNNLEAEAEETQHLSFLDILLKLEKFGYLESHEIWLKLIETRNIVTHEYPQHVNDIVEGLNLLHNDIVIISDIWKDLRDAGKKKG